MPNVSAVRISCVFDLYVLFLLLSIHSDYYISNLFINLKIVYKISAGPLISTLQLMRYFRVRFDDI